MLSSRRAQNQRSRIRKKGIMSLVTSERGRRKYFTRTRLGNGALSNIHNFVHSFQVIVFQVTHVRQL